MRMSSSWPKSLSPPAADTARPGFFARWDRGIRIIVGILSIIGLIVAFPDVVRPAIGITVAVASLAAAVVLNILPVSDWSRDHAELFRLWSDLRKDAVLEEHETCEAEDEKEAASFRFRRLCELTGKAEALDALEPAPNQKLLLRCYGDEMEHLWGTGVRTEEQAEQKRRQRHATPSALVVASEAKPEQEPAADVGG